MESGGLSPPESFFCKCLIINSIKPIEVIMSNDNVSANNLFAATVLAQLEADFQTYISAFADWAAFASQMETREGSNKIVARTEYELNNECSNTWAALYGNTTDTKFIPDRNTEIDNRTRFCARLNVAYWEDRKAQYLDKNPNLDPQAPEYNEMDATADMELLNIYVSLEEAVLNFNRLLAKFHMVRNMYETVTGAAFEYKPYTVSQKNSATVAANAKLGAALLKRAAA